MREGEKIMKNKKQGSVQVVIAHFPNCIRNCLGDTIIVWCHVIIQE